MRSTRSLQTALLAWYAENRRAMPWRALPGQAADPYRVWLSEIMLQQTTVTAVIPYFLKFVGRWPTVRDLAAAPLDEVLAAWAGLGYYSRARNLHACAKTLVQDFKGRFPGDEEELRGLPGIGPYTAAAIASIAFNRQAVAVDGNVERVVSRFFSLAEPLPGVKPALKEGAARLARDNPSPADFTQAFMELGATVCTPRNPRCGECPWKTKCAARAKGIAQDLPRRAVKKKKPLRTGKVFLIEDAKGRVCIHKKQGAGLYAGMYQLPTTDWADRKGLGLLPFVGPVKTKALGLEVRHSFTHFDLVLEVWRGTTKVKTPVPDAIWIAREEAEKYALPSLMTRVLRGVGQASSA